ncbi:MAG TPA: hypothetical protein PK045_03035 [Candidatus Woesebacteria bacterium]|nr:hypothetical protein [Candidatus Woesebacteria bacterium]
MNWLKKIEKIVLIGMIVIGVVGRFVWLDKFPSGMSHDEIEYVMSAKSYWEKGSDLSGIRFPESIFRTKTEGIISFLPAMLLAPIYGNIPLSQTTARLPYGLLNLLTGCGLFLWIREIFKNKKIAIWGLILFLFSPWSFYFSRMASDTAWALMFSVFGLWQLQKQKRSNLVMAFILLLLAFFSYHGAKVVLPLAILWGAIIYKNKNTWIMTIGFLAVALGYFGALKFLPDSIYGSRKSDIVFLDQELLANKVDTQRKLTVENKFTQVFENKLIAGIEIFTKNYLTAFSPAVLLSEGDGRGTYSFKNHGLLYLIEVFLILVGLVWLFKTKNNYRWYLVGLILISPIATGLSLVETSVINRSFLLLPLFLILGAIGINQTRFRPFLLLILVVSFINFLFFYFYRWPKVNQESYFLSERVMANYLRRNKDINIVVINDEPREIKLEAEFYGSKNKFIEYINYCPKIFDRETVYLIERSLDCQIKDYLSIKEEEFWGPLILIVNDKLCEKENLEPWVNRKVDDYAIEKMDNKNFCQRWIRK